MLHKSKVSFCYLKDVPVYVTIDLDVLDLGTFPGTGTPEPGGITYKELLAGIAALQDLNQIVAADVVELFTAIRSFRRFYCCGLQDCQRNAFDAY